MTRHSIAPVLGLMLLLGALPMVALAHSPTSGAEYHSFGGATTVNYKLIGISATSDLGIAVNTSLEVNFRDAATNNSRIPLLNYLSSGTAQVIFSSDLESPCSNTGNYDWLQCATNGGTTSWRIYIRDFDDSNKASWEWKEVQGCPSTDTTCWYVKRAMIHEAGHAMATFDDLNGASETNTVMNGDSPPVPTAGATTFKFRRCDEAAINVTYAYQAYFEDTSGDGLDDSSTVGFTISWNAFC